MNIQSSDMILSRRNYKAGYIITREEVSDGDGGVFEMRRAYNLNGVRIGDPKWAYRICKTRGVVPEKANSDHNICSIGFCKKEQKWYGWSHRAIWGFGLESTVKAGDCAYVPFSAADFSKDCKRFWSGKNHINVSAIEDTQDGVKGIQVNWEYDNLTPNKKIRGTISGVFTPYPDEYGHGEWTAKSLEEARQMAIDFAEGVS